MKLNNNPVYTVKHNGYPRTDGRYKVILAPNTRIHYARVTGTMIQLQGQRWPIEMNLILGDDDQWVKLDEKN